MHTAHWHLLDAFSVSAATQGAYQVSIRQALRNKLYLLCSVLVFIQTISTYLHGRFSPLKFQGVYISIAATVQSVTKALVSRHTAQRVCKAFLNHYQCSTESLQSLCKSREIYSKARIAEHISKQRELAQKQKALHKKQSVSRTFGYYLLGSVVMHTVVLR